jgi:hypothetical protein
VWPVVAEFQNFTAEKKSPINNCQKFRSNMGQHDIAVTAVFIGQVTELRLLLTSSITAESMGLDSWLMF